MDSEQYSLSNLRDIVVPDPPPFWPPAPGVWVVLGILTAVVAIACWRLFGAWRRNGHRRAGLALLGGADTAHDVSVILKRVALAVFPRRQVASLYGEAWISFLNMTCPGSDLSAMGTLDSNARASQELLQRADIWIRQHRVPGGQTRGTES